MIMFFVRVIAQSLAFLDDILHSRRIRILNAEAYFLGLVKISADKMKGFAKLIIDFINQLQLLDHMLNDLIYSIFLPNTLLVFNILQRLKH